MPSAADRHPQRAAKRCLLDYIQHFASSFMFAASAAPPSVAAAMAALDVMQEEPWRMDQLRKNYTYMREELKKMGFDVGTTMTRFEFGVAAIIRFKVSAYSVLIFFRSR